jgi:hypothetical protein
MCGDRANVMAEPSRGLPTLQLVAVASSITRVGSAEEKLKVGEQL